MLSPDGNGLYLMQFWVPDKSSCKLVMASQIKLMSSDLFINIITDQCLFICLKQQCVPVAQWLEHCISSPKVVGSNSQGTH